MGSHKTHVPNHQPVGYNFVFPNFSLRFSLASLRVDFPDPTYPDIVGRVGFGWLYHLVMTNCLPWKDPPFLIGKPSISMGHL